MGAIFLLLVCLSPLDYQEIPYDYIDMDGDGLVSRGDKEAAAWFEANVGGLTALLTNPHPATGIYDLSTMFQDAFLQPVELVEGTANSTTLAITDADVDAFSDSYVLEPELSHCLFLRGDANADGSISLLDGLFLMQALFQGGPPPVNFDSADYDDDGGTGLNDAIGIMNYAFAGGDPPQPPFPLKGYDGTYDVLSPECDGYSAKIQRIAFQGLMEDLNLFEEDLVGGRYDADLTLDGYDDLVLNLPSGIKAYSFNVELGTYEFLQDLPFSADLIQSVEFAGDAAPCLVAVDGGTEITIEVFEPASVLSGLATISFVENVAVALVDQFVVSLLDDGVVVWPKSTSLALWLQHDASTGQIASLTRYVLVFATPPQSSIIEDVAPAFEVDPAGERSFVVKSNGLNNQKTYTIVTFNSTGVSLLAGGPTNVAAIPWLRFHPGSDLLPPSSDPPTGCVPRPSPGWAPWPGNQHIEVEVALKSVEALKSTSAASLPAERAQLFRFPMFHVASKVDNSNEAACSTIDIGLAQRCCGVYAQFRSVEFEMNGNNIQEMADTAKKSSVDEDWSEQQTGLWDYTQTSEPPFYPKVKKITSSKARRAVRGSNSDINAALNQRAVPRLTLGSVNAQGQPNGQVATLLIRDQPEFPSPVSHGLEWSLNPDKLVTITSASTYLRFSAHVISKAPPPENYFMGFGFRTFGSFAQHKIKPTAVKKAKNLRELGYLLGSKAMAARQFQSIAYEFIDDLVLPTGGGDAYRLDSIPISGSATDAVAQALSQAQATPE